MGILQDQSLIALMAALLAIAAAWWILRGAWRWIKRLSRLGCLALLGLMILLAVVGGPS
jgi:choline-glycine betaine transporter